MSSMRVERKTDTKNGVARLVFVAISLTLQVAFFYFMWDWASDYSIVLKIGTTVISAIVVLIIYGRHMTSSMKMPWLVMIAFLPILGIILWNLMESEAATGPMRRRFASINATLQIFLEQDDHVQEELRSAQSESCRVSEYLWRTGHYPLCRAEEATFYGDTREALKAQLADLEKAEHFIFMEYYAIENREAFAQVREVLRRKVQEGVEVRLFYDDVGSIGFITTNFARQLQEDGIDTRIFNKVMPSLRIFMNNRDHRKITVIDGKIAFTGGYNLADEYFNITHPYGEWSDAGIRITGPAVHTYTTLFLEMWNAIRNSDKDDTDFGRYFPGLKIPDEVLQLYLDRYSPEEIATSIENWRARQAALEPRDGETVLCGASEPEQAKGQGSGSEGAPVRDYGPEFVQPYADSPLDEQQIGEDVYMTIVNSAERYVWFVTPYLILTDEMSRCLTLAAERGVDVRIVTPGIPDKKIAYQLTRSYYAQLVCRGVRIYEFTPGFCHDKICASDDRICTCGTINLDYRSLYHHFEDGCVMYSPRLCEDVKGKMEQMMSRCNEVTELYRKGQISLPLSVFRCMLRLFAPIM